MFRDAPSRKARWAPASSVSEPLFRWYGLSTMTTPHSRPMTRFSFSAPPRLFGQPTTVAAAFSSPPETVGVGAAAAPRLAGTGGRAGAATACGRGEGDGVGSAEGFLPQPT